MERIVVYSIIDHAVGRIFRIFNSIQFRHLYAPANEHQVGAHGEEKKL